MGGTFDQIHVGHLMLLASAEAATVEEVFVGVTGKDYMGAKLLANSTCCTRFKSF